MAATRISRGQKTPARLACTAICAAIALALPMCPARAADPQGIGTRPEVMVLRVTLNTEDKGDLFVQRTADSDFFIKIEDLRAMGFKDPAGTMVLLDGAPHLSLKSMRGVTYALELKTLALNITAEPELLPNQALSARAERRRGQSVPSTNSAFFNYAISGSRASSVETRVDFSGETGVRLGDYLLLSDATTVQGPEGSRLVRLMSSITRDDTQNLQRMVIGDLLTPTRDFSAGVNLGGIGITKLYGLNPYFVRFPTQTLNGSVALPSDLEVYIDGQRIRAERLKPGEFELRDILAYGGAQNVQVLLRDPFGRVQQLNYSLYFTDQALQQGLHEYSYNFGAQRRRFGAESNAYGPAAFTMFHRYGFGPGFTLGWRAEGTRRLLNTGPTATIVLGNLGVANLAVAHSTIGGRQGHGELVSYSYQGKKWSAGLTLRHDSAAFATLGDPPTMTNRRYEGTASATYRVPGGSVSLSHTGISTRRAAAVPVPVADRFATLLMEQRRVSTLSYTALLGRAALTAGMSRIKSASGGSRNEATLGLNFFLGQDYSSAMNYRGDRDGHQESVRFTKNQPVGEGLGYVVSLDHSSTTTESTQLRSNIQYNAPAAVLRADFGMFQGSGQKGDDVRLSVAGGVATVGGHVVMTRPVTDSYAVVKVGELPGVEVMVNGQPMGRTDSHGVVVLPTLSAYYENNVSIAPGVLPMEYSMPAATKRVAPALRSGAFVDFALVKTQGFGGKLKSARGAVEFQEIQVSIDGKEQTFATGRGGEFYMENLKPGTYPATVPVDGKACVFELTIPASNEIFVDFGDVLCAPRP